MRTYFFPSCLKYAALWVGICLSVAPASAASYYWDANGGTGGAGNTGGTGTWDTTSSLWRNGGISGALGVWPNPDPSTSTAVFGDVTGNVTIAADTTIYANGLDFSTPSAPLIPWRLQSGNPASRLVLSGPTNTITMAATTGGYQFFTTVFNTQVELRGTTTISGTSVRMGIGVNPLSSSTSGSLTIASGGIANFFSSGAGRNTVFAVGSQTGPLNSGVSSVTGSADFTGGRMSLYTSGLVVGVVSTDAAISSLHTATVTGSLNSGSDSGTVLDGLGASVVGQIYLYAGTASTYVGSTTGTLNWGGGTATFSNNAHASNAALFVGRFISDTANGTNAAAASGTINISGGTFNISSTETLNKNVLSLTVRSTILHANSTASATVNLTGGTLNITGGDIYGGGGTSTFTLNGGTLDLNGGNLGRTGELITTLNFQSGTLLDVFQINNGAALNKTTTGTLTLNGTNSYTGATTISEGTLSASNIVVSGGNSHLGNATSAVGLGAASTKGTLSYTGNTATYTRGFTIGNGGGQLDVTTSGQTLTVGTGAVTGTAGLLTVGGAGNTMIASAITTGTGGLTKTGAGTLTLSSSGNTFTGLTTVTEGTLQYGVANALSSGAVTVNGGTLNLGGFTDTVGAVTLSSGTISNGTLTSSAGYSATNTGTVSAVLAGSGAFTKTGNGSVTFSAVNTYTGDTIVSAGSLVISSTGSVASNLIQVQTGAEFDGSAVSGGFELKNDQTLENKGTFTGNLTALSGSTYAPGNSPGIATQVGDLTFNTGSTFEWELIANTDAVAGTNFDQTVFTSGGLTIQTGVTANLVFNAGSTVDWANAFWGSDQQWLVFSGADSLSNVAGIFTNITVGADAFSQSLASVRSGASFSFTNVGDDVYLTYSIPEPSTTLLLAGALTALVIFRRRRARD